MTGQGDRSRTDQWQLTRRHTLTLAGGSVAALAGIPGTTTAKRTLDITDGEDIGPYLEQINNGDTVRIPDGTYRFSGAKISANNWTVDGNGATIQPVGNPNLSLSGRNWEFRGVRWDVTPDTNVQIHPSGGPWRFANCAWDGPNGSRQYLVHPRVRDGTKGILEQCWFGDGVARDSSEPGGWWNESAIKGVTDIHGQFIMRGCYFHQNGAYIAASAPSNARTHTGSHHIEDCYFEDCYIADVRIGTPVGDTCTATNTTFVFEGYDDVPATNHSGGIKRSRGLYVYWNNAEVTDCDFACTDESAIATGKGGSATVTDSEIKGRTGDVTTQNTGSDPDPSPPASCVTSADEAVTGTTNSPPDTPTTTPDPDTQQLQIVSTADAPVFSYRFTVDGTATKQPHGTHSADTEDAVDETENTATITGQVGRGGGDTFEIAGEVTSASVDAPPAHYTVTLDGETLDVADTPNEADANPPDGFTKRVVLDGTATDHPSSYDLTVSGDIQKDESLVDAGEITDSVAASEASGIVEAGGKDAYWITGEVTDSTITGKATLTVTEVESDTTDTEPENNAADEEVTNAFETLLTGDDTPNEVSQEEASALTTILRALLTS